MSSQRQRFIVSTSTAAEKVFPDSIATNEKSLTFMYRTLAVAFSSVAYLRNMFPSEAFTLRSWEGCQIPIVNANYPRSKALMIYISKGIFDAMKRGYLRQAVLGICNDADKPEEVVEAYTFRFQYESGAPSLTISDHNGKNESENLIPAEASKQHVKRLLGQMSYFVQCLENLSSPDNAFFTIKLSYYEDKTPPDYEPPNFKSCQTPDFDFNGAKKIFAHSLGRVKTSYHSCRMGVRSTLCLKAGNSLNEEKLFDCTNKTPTRSYVSSMALEDREESKPSSKRKKASVENAQKKSIS